MATPLFDLSGKMALITGSTRGIGLAMAKAMVHAGAAVAISSRTADECESVAERIRATGGQAVSIPGNISNPGVCEQLVARTEGQLGAIDILICNAAINPYYGPFLNTPDDAFNKTIAVNIRANMHLCAAAVPRMAARGGGAIVVVSSIVAFAGSHMLGLYALTKAADLQLVRNLAAAHGRQGIRVNGIAPAVVRTEFARALWEDPAQEEQLAAACPLGRIGEPDDIAGAAVYLTAPASAWIDRAGAGAGRRMVSGRPDCRSCGRVRQVTSPMRHTPATPPAPPCRANRKYQYWCDGPKTNRFPTVVVPNSPTSRGHQGCCHTEERQDAGTSQAVP